MPQSVVSFTYLLYRCDAWLGEWTSVGPEVSEFSVQVSENIAGVEWLKATNDGVRRVGGMSCSHWE